jgi:hypothetical protein
MVRVWDLVMKMVTQKIRREHDRFWTMLSPLNLNLLTASKSLLDLNIYFTDLTSQDMTMASSSSNSIANAQLLPPH